MRRVLDAGVDIKQNVENGSKSQVSWGGVKRRTAVPALVVVAIALFAGALFLTSFQGSANAEPLCSQETVGPSVDELAVKGILKEHGSPLPWWTIVAFKCSHPSFDIAGFLSVMWRESSLGKDCGAAVNNPGCIKFGGWEANNPDLAVWHLWMNGYRWTSHGRFGTFSSMYWGQRAAIRLVWDAGYNDLLAAGDWWGFANRYYGAGPGAPRYAKDLEAAHGRIIQEAAAYGASW